MEKFHGAYVAIITPFINGEVDEQSFVDLIEFQIANGTHGIVPCGTTGESATLSFDEHKQVMDLAIKTVAGRVPVIAGAGANNTLEAIDLSESAKESGADAILSVAPYYNKPSQEGIYQHFKAIAEAVDIPMFLYNVPGRTVVNIAPETTARLAGIDNIIGIKEACGCLEQISDVIRKCPEDFIVLSGDDFTSMPTNVIGGKGVISVISNVFPKGMAEMQEATFAGDWDRARQLHYQMYDMMKQMFAAPSPAPAKKALELMGVIREGLPRIPMTPIDDDNLANLKLAMKGLNLI
ncbi:4-hydroxy-tetrahydrodipicolinate synthase [Desulfotalea psychrophila]|nr:4-hydroxy-tetrahydrodipicolinate synthase [Desulfotalea psychrophila]